METSHERPDEANVGEPHSDVGHWAQPVEKLTTSHLPADAINLNVEGRQVVGPLQGFGKMWQKTYEVRLSGCAAPPREVIRVWKENFSAFWPSGNRFYGPITGIAPGEVAVLNLAAPGMKLSTGVLVLYADDESFTFMNPQGHPFAGWITFRAFEEDGCTVAQAQVLVRANDPLWELVMSFGGYGKENEFWHDTLKSLAAHFSVEGQPLMKETCVDPKRQWSEAKNIWHNAAIRSALYTLVAPVRWVGRPFRRTHN